MQMLAGPTGLPQAVGAIAERERLELAQIGAEQVAAQQVAFEVAEKSAGVRYPAVYVYCQGVANLLKEKFRTFSGKVYLAVEVRVTSDRLEDVSRQLQAYTSAVTDVLDAHRGEWAPGMYYAGAYKVEFGPVKHGGKNFLQAAKVQFEVEASG
jgi:hypothetical protein